MQILGAWLSSMEALRSSLRGHCHRQSTTRVHAYGLHSSTCTNKRPYKLFHSSHAWGFLYALRANGGYHASCLQRNRQRRDMPLRYRTIQDQKKGSHTEVYRVRATGGRRMNGSVGRMAESMMHVVSVRVRPPLSHHRTECAIANLPFPDLDERQALKRYSKA